MSCSAGRLGPIVTLAGAAGLPLPDPSALMRRQLCTPFLRVRVKQTLLARAGKPLAIFSQVAVACVRWTYLDGRGPARRFLEMVC